MLIFLAYKEGYRLEVRTEYNKERNTTQSKLYLINESSREATDISDLYRSDRKVEILPEGIIFREMARTPGKLNSLLQSQNLSSETINGYVIFRESGHNVDTTTFKTFTDYQTAISELHTVLLDSNLANLFFVTLARNGEVECPKYTQHTEARHEKRKRVNPDYPNYT